jgi:hypothetical protein
LLVGLEIFTAAGAVAVVVDVAGGGAGIAALDTLTADGIVDEEIETAGETVVVEIAAVESPTAGAGTVALEIAGVAANGAVEPDTAGTVVLDPAAVKEDDATPATVPVETVG